MTALEGATVLVTGGAGTIGSTIVDQLLDAGVAHVDVLDNLVRGRREVVRLEERGGGSEELLGVVMLLPPPSPR